MKKILFAIVGITFLLIMLYNLTPYLYKNINFEYVGKGYSLCK